MNSLRVSELAKELGMTSKEVIEKFAEVDIIVKSHSNTVTGCTSKEFCKTKGFCCKKSQSCANRRKTG